MKSYLYLGIFVLALSMTACEKNTESLVISDPTPEQQFDRMQKPLVLFQFAERQIETGVERGWIIDKDGWVKTYEIKNFPGTELTNYNEIVSNITMNVLYESATEDLFQIDKVTLLGHIYEANAMQQQDLSEIETDMNAQLGTGIYAYQRKVSYDQSPETDACAGGNYGANHQGMSYSSLQRKVVELSGTQSRVVTTEGGQALQQWLLGLNVEIAANLDR